jgi:hypothetical protein
VFRAGVVDVAELLVALPGEGDYVAGVPGGEFRIEPGGLFVGEVFGADLQRPADTKERIALASPVSERVLLDPAADFVDHGRAELDDVEGVQNRDGFGQFVADRVGVAAERVQRRCFEPGGEVRAAVFEPIRVGFPDRPGTKSSNRAWSTPWASRVWSTIPVTMPDPGGRPR